MSYQIYLSNGTLLTTIQDGTVDNSTSLSLLGRLYADYGTVVAADLVHMLENSANVFPPANPLAGQLWYDSSINIMKVWNGSVWYSLTAVSSVLGNIGAITLAQLVAGGVAPLVSPDFTAGIPLGPTAAIGTSDDQLATTRFVISQMGTITSGVSSIISLTGAVTLSQLVLAGVAALASPVLTGTPTAPTAPVNTASTQLATTAFVQNVISNNSGVASVIGLTGIVTLSQLSLAGLAPLASPALTGIPTAPTALLSTATTQLATTAFVQSLLATKSGVASVAGLTGIVTLTQLVTAGVAPLLSPALTGIPTAPTAVVGTVGMQVATCGFVAAQVRIRLAGPLNIYINATLGADTNLGLTQATAFQTIQAAYNYVANNYDLAGNAVAFNLAKGTYQAGLDAAVVLTGQDQALYFVGNVASPASVVVNCAAIQTDTFSASLGAVIDIQGMTINSSGTGQGGFCIRAQSGGLVYYANVIFGPAVSGHIVANFGGFIQCVGNYSISGSAPTHLSIGGGDGSYDGSGGAYSINVTVTGSPTFSTAFISVSGASMINFAGTTFTGAASGPRYNVSYGATIQCGGTALFFPGSTAGSNTQGYYT